MRPEPRGMTLGDAMTLSVGVALSFAIERWPGGMLFAFSLSPAAYLMILVFRVVWATGMAIAAAALARSAKHGRPAGPGEWLAFLVAAEGVVALHPQAFLFAEQPLVIRHGLDFSTARWIIAAAWAMVLLPGVALLPAIARRTPPWVVSASGLILALIALGGPFAVAQNEVPLLASPLDGPGGTSEALLAVQARERIAETPTWLMFAVPAVALASRWSSRRTWTWTEWAGAVVFLPALAQALFLRETFFRPMSGYWIADHAFGMAWLGFVSLLARWIVGAWSRRGQRAASAARTSST